MKYINGHWQKEVLESIALCDLKDCPFNITDDYHKSEVNFCKLSKLNMIVINGTLSCWHYSASRLTK